MNYLKLTNHREYGHNLIKQYMYSMGARLFLKQFLKNKPARSRSYDYYDSSDDEDEYEDAYPYINEIRTVPKKLLSSIDSDGNNLLMQILSYQEQFLIKAIAWYPVIIECILDNTDFSYYNNENLTIWYFIPYYSDAFNKKLCDIERDIANRTDYFERDFAENRLYLIIAIKNIYDAIRRRFPCIDFTELEDLTERYANCNDEISEIRQRINKDFDNEDYFVNTEKYKPDQHRLVTLYSKRIKISEIFLSKIAYLNM